MPHRQRIPSFFWQGVLILLPVTLMAVFCFWAILRERKEVDRAALEQARAVLGSLPADFGQMVGKRLTQFDHANYEWHSYLENGVAAWPQNADRQLWLSNSNLYATDLTTLKSAFSEWRDGPFPQIEILMDTNGFYTFGRHEDPPHPPRWIRELTPQQRQSWFTFQIDALKSHQLDEATNLAKAFDENLYCADAIASVNFLRLRADSFDMPASNAVKALLDFATKERFTVSDSGLPVSTLALAEALKRSRDIGPTKQLWNCLRDEVNDQCILTPTLLDQAEELVSTNAALITTLKALRTIWAGAIAEAQMAETIRQAKAVHGIITTNLWTDLMGRHWLCILSPVEMLTVDTNYHDLSVSARCYPTDLVERGFADALQDARFSLPAYFGVSIQLAGEQVRPPVAWEKQTTGKPGGEILAVKDFQMWSQAAVDASSYKTTGNPFLHQPANTPFTLSIRLTDRSLLFAHQRKLQFILASVIAASAFAALVGFVTARGAFRRQQQLSEMKSNFVSSVSHELRAPIASVRLLAENLEQGKVLEAGKQGEYFHFIVQECQRLSSLIENILDFSRIEQGRKQYEFESTDMVALGEKTLKLMEPYARDRGVLLKSALPETATAEVDAKAIQQALVNLIDNATKHSPKSSTVTAGILETADLLQLWVEDQGDGILLEEQEKIFERFYRSGSELRRETQGVGIGLSIVKHIVEAHRGTIKVKSQIGTGSRFTIEIPKRGSKEEKRS